MNHSTVPPGLASIGRKSLPDSARVAADELVSVCEAARWVESQGHLSSDLALSAFVGDVERISGELLRAVVEHALLLPASVASD